MAATIDPSRFLIVGANGQLGTALANKYPEATPVDSGELDITDPKAVAAFDWSKVDIILNAAAYTNVDGAESNEGRVIAWKVNAVGVRNLVAAAIEHDLTIFHISSEYVFDGTSNDPHTEDEPLSPLGVYAATKAGGDVAISLAPKHYLLRTSWVIGEGKNFVRTMLSLGERGISPTVVGDQIGRLTFTYELVCTIDHFLQNKPAYGTYNVSNTGEPASWADITREIFKLGGYDNLTVTDTTTAEYFADKPEASPRPLNSVMNLDKVKATGVELTDWREALKLYIGQEESKKSKEGAQ